MLDINFKVLNVKIVLRLYTLILLHNNYEQI